MLALIFSVVVASLSGVMTPGPMFAVTVAKSYRSPWAGAKVSVGHAIVEVPLILLIYFGFARLFSHTVVQIALSLVGGAVFVWMAIGMFRSRREVEQTGRDLKYGAVTAGIVTSAINPFFLLWWATAGSMLVMKSMQLGTAGLPVFILSHWTCDLVWLSIVSLAIYRTKTLWGAKLHMAVFIVCGLILLGYGGWYIASGVGQIF